MNTDKVTDKVIEKMKSEITAIQESLNQGQSDAAKKGEDLILQCMQLLDEGKIRVAEKVADNWVTHVWVKQAILMYFRIREMEEISVGPFVYRDKIPLKTNFRSLNVRVVPPAVARYGSFLESGVILMPSYVNIGAYVGSNTMVDTWATVGSCAQIGSNVHLSGGVGIGGVLEPPQASPVIIEDGAFLGSRAIVVEGVHIGKEAVLGANVTLTASTPIIDLRSNDAVETKGRIPPRCVVVPGTKEKIIGAGKKIYTQCAYIIGERKASTDLKTSLNAALRDFDVSA